MAWKLQEYNGTAWLDDPILFDLFDELQDHITAKEAEMEPEAAEAYLFNSIWKEVSDDEAN